MNCKTLLFLCSAVLIAACSNNSSDKNQDEKKEKQKEEKTSKTGGNVQADSDELCDCFGQVTDLFIKNASKEEIEKEKKKCEDLFNEIESKYIDDAEKMKEFDEAGTTCGDNIKDKYGIRLEEAEQQWKEKNL